MPTFLIYDPAHEQFRPQYSILSGTLNRPERSPASRLSTLVKRNKCIVFQAKLLVPDLGSHLVLQRHAQVP